MTTRRWNVTRIRFTGFQVPASRRSSLRAVFFETRDCSSRECENDPPHCSPLPASFAAKIAAFVVYSFSLRWNINVLRLIASNKRLTFLLSDEYLIVDLLPQQHRMQVVQERLKMLRPIAKRYYYGDAMTGYALRGTASSARFNVHEFLLYLRIIRRCSDHE